MPTESRSWFERAIFDLSIAQAHFQSRLWTGAALHARQAAVKFLQAGLAHTREIDPSPRIRDLRGNLRARAPGFAMDAAWDGLDRYAGDAEFTEVDARLALQWAAGVRDAVAALLG